ncbi:WAT1-related protein At1g60050-like [Nicotiana tabacum]|uniref:WAT1-related protein At1g60050-like n=1 Tax=Nicotiana tabacum TaxID=4097 RepID=A0AC58STQ3_TOBAC
MRIGFLVAAASFALTIWSIIQAGSSKKHPQVMNITCLYTLFGTIQSAVFALLMEKNLSAWRLKLNFELLVIVLTAMFGSLIRSSVQMWCMRLKGPSYALFFKPVGVPVASTCRCVLFAATFSFVTVDFSDGRENRKYGNPNGWGDDQFIEVII